MIPKIDLVAGKGQDYFEKLMNRSQLDSRAEREIVVGLIDDVRARGDAAVLEATARLDGAQLTPDTLRVTPEEMDAAYARIAPELLASLQRAADNIRDFHARQKRQTPHDAASVRTGRPGGRP